MTKTMNPPIKFLIFFLLFLIAGTVVTLIYLSVISKGTIKPFTDEKGDILPDSIAEKNSVEINGVPQSMFIRGKSLDNPVLLFVHGGPGVPEYFLNEYYPIDLEEHFTVCWWEYRGSGLSYSPNLDPDTITTEQLADDTAAVAEYLCNRFAKEKVYLMGHSFGSFIGLKAAQMHPEQFYAYIGMAQINGYSLGGTEANTLTYEYMEKVFTERKDKASLRQLNACSVKHEDGTVSFKSDCFGKLDQLKHKSGCGTMHHMDSVITGIFFPQMNSRCYTLSEKINYWKGKKFMQSSAVYKDSQYAEVQKEVLHLDIPVYFFSGIYDYTCPHPLSRELYELLDAPKKEFYLFEHSAHSPLWEEPEKAIDILVNITSSVSAP